MIHFISFGCIAAEAGKTSRHSERGGCRQKVKSCGKLAISCLHISFFFFFTDINISYSTLLILFKISLFYIFLSYYSHSFSNFSFLYLLYNKIIQTSCNFFYLYSINKKSCDNKCAIMLL